MANPNDYILEGAVSVLDALLASAEDGSVVWPVSLLEQFKREQHELYANNEAPYNK